MPRRIFRPLTLWRSGILREQSSHVVQDTLLRHDLVWLPSPGRWAFRADPFGLWEDGCLHVFVETFHYSDRRGYIEVLTYSEKLELLSTDLALREPWHLSYPYVFSFQSEHWMLPEAERSGRLTLYRANAFPIGWKAELTIPLPAGALDATPLFWNGKWWLFYCIKQRRTSEADRANQLHLAFADDLGGPWKLHPKNPVRVGLSSCRPGGSPLIGDGLVDLPVQDARTTYGGALRRLRITVLDEERFEADERPWLHPPAAFAPFHDGLHTLSSAGDVSLIDVKRVDGSLHAALSNAWFKLTS